MKLYLSVAGLALLLIGCQTGKTITEPSGAERSWEPAKIDWRYSGAPVSSSTDTDKYIWTQSPVPTVPPKHDWWWPD